MFAIKYGQPTECSNNLAAGDISPAEAIGHLEVVPGSMLPSGGEGTRPRFWRGWGLGAHLGYPLVN